MIENINPINDQVQSQLISWILLNQNQIGLGSVPAGVLSTTLQQILPPMVRSYTGEVYTQTNNSLNQGPVQLIGTNNPFNTLTQNQNTNLITSAVLSKLGTPGTNALQNNLIGNMVGGLQGGLGNFGNNVNFQLVTAAIAALVGPLFNKLNTQVSGNFIDGVLNSGFDSEPFLDAEDYSFGEITGDPEESLEAVDESYTKSATDVFLQQAKNFNIQEPDNLDKLSVVKEGFVDPTATYPTKEYAEGSEVNKLAQGEPTNSLVQAKNKKLMKAAPLPGENFFNEPPSAYKAEYPYNKVTETESGHIIEIDDTPGSERIHVYHKAGTYIEIDRDGNTVFRRKGSDYQIIDKNGYVSVAGHLNLSVAGSVNLFAGNNANVEIIGDAKLTVHNDFVLEAGGNINISAADTLSMHAANIRLEADNDFDIQVDATYKHRANVIHSISTKETYIEVGEDFNLTGNAAAAIYFKDDYKVKSDKKIKHKGKLGVENSSTLGGVTSKSPAGGMNMDASGFNIRSSGQLNIDATAINFQNNQATALDSLDFDLDDPVRPEGARNAFSGLLVGRKDFVSIKVEDSQAISIADKYCIDAEEQSDDPETKKQLRDKLISSGLATEADLDKKPVEQSDVQAVSTNNAQIVAPSAFCLGLTEAPDSFKLSPNFTLGQLTSRSACSATPLVAQAGLSYGQLLQNLQAVALNICEPVFNLYPNMYITSGFRTVGSNPTSQHPKGQAVDIQFKGIAASEYFKIANLLAKALNYDQLLLEYSNYTRNPWIHISFSHNTKNRNQVLTFWNNKTHAQGLVQLA
jgi:hypothetical protein